jgi:hypothetical protein
MVEDAIEDLASCEHVNLKSSVSLFGKKVRLDLQDYPIQLNISADRAPLYIYPEHFTLHSERSDLKDSYILVDPHSYFNEISSFYRLQSGDDLMFGRKDLDHPFLNDEAIDSKDRHLSITNKEGSLVFKSFLEKGSSCISPLLKKKDVLRIKIWRQAKLKRIRSIYSGPIKALADKEALTLIKKINELGANNPWQEKDSKGKPGGVLKLPSGVQPILVGDLHGKVDNLLVILSQNGFLKALKKGTACLIILGDAVHSEEKGELEDMDSSILIMDLIFSLMLRFPQGVHYVLGNHDSFCENIGKQGMPQGLIWERALIKARGNDYRDEMERFYRQQPLIAYSKSFIACHAAPPVSNVVRQELVDIRNNPKLIMELVANRIRRPNRPGGYYNKEVKRFRKIFGLKDDAPVIVGHTPMTHDETFWEVKEIANHYVIYGSDKKWIAAMTEIEGRMVPFLYPTERLIKQINAL